MAEQAAQSAPVSSEPTTTTTTAEPTTTTTTATTETLFPTSTETATKTDSRPDWLSSKYTSVEEQAKAYPELHKLYMEKGDIPEKYDFTETFQKHGIEIANPAEYETFQTEFRELGLNQRQASALVDRYGRELKSVVEPLQARIAELTPPNLKEERAKIEQEYGERAKDTLTSAGKWARSNLPSDVAEALGRSANGIKFVVQMMNGERGPVPIIEHTSPSALDPGEIQTKIKDIQSDPGYMKNDAKGKQMQKEAYNLHKQLRMIRGQPLTS